MTSSPDTSPTDTQTANVPPKTSWGQSLANAAKSSGLLTAKFGILAGTFLTGAGLAFTLTNIHNNNEREIIDDITSSNPSAPIVLSENLQVIPSDTSLTVISYGIPCEIPLQDPIALDATLGNTGEATVSEATSILQTLGITSDSHLTTNPAENAEAILRLRYAAAAACRADMLRAQGLNETRAVEAGQNVIPSIADAPALVPGNE